jgi:pimeloyl-ACP methyl ester carboxylesterase
MDIQSLEGGAYCRQDRARMTPLAIAGALGAIALLALAPGAVPPARAAGAAAASAAGAQVRFEPCRLEHRSRLQAFAAECSRLRVPENRAVPAGRQIELFIARIPAINRRKAPDPLFLIAGGPGMGSAQMYAGVAQAFARVGRDRDLVLVDQRGTGRSAPLGCELSEGSMIDADEAMIRAITQRCLAALSAGHDVTQYTTSVAVQDLEAVRAALGYERVNLYGVSYGTRVALHYLRRFPQRTRLAILDGVVPPGLALGPDIALDAEAALGRILARCAAESSCRRAHGDPGAHYRALRERLGGAPVAVALPDPTTAAPRQLAFGPQHLGAVLRLQSYAASTAALLPYALAAANRDENFLPLAGIFLMAEASTTDLLAYGMHNSVVCTEDLPFVDTARVDRAQLAATYLGASPLDGLRTICSLWPRGVLDTDLRAPLRSAVPVLLLSGADDPVTPPANATAVQAGLSRSKHVVVPDSGHGQVGLPCMDAVFQAFLRDADPAALDTRCLARARPDPFFTSAAGPAP